MEFISAGLSLRSRVLPIFVAPLFYLHSRVRYTHVPFYIDNIYHAHIQEHNLNSNSSPLGIVFPQLTCTLMTKEASWNHVLKFSWTFYWQLPLVQTCSFTNSELRIVSPFPTIWVKTLTHSCREHLGYWVIKCLHGIAVGALIFQGVS